MKNFVVLLSCFAVLSGARAQQTAMAFEELGASPSAPARSRSFSASFASQLTFTNFLRITNRETARQFYNLVFAASEGVPMNWSGTYAGAGSPGTNSTDYLNAVMRRVNYFRAMAGVPGWITFSNEFSRKAQAAALMMGGNNQINHFPPPTWKYYTADGAEAAQNSNLSLGNAGPQAVMSQVRDNGANNAVAGHRRWVLYPQTQLMGSGNVPATGTNMAAGVLWVFDSNYGGPRPATRESFVAWPPPGYVPHNVVYARWSFSHPTADFTSASVTITSNGVPLSMWIEPVTDGYGDNTIVFIPGTWDENSLENYPKPATNTTYHVTLTNVRIGGVPQTFSYDVVIFDPTAPGPDYFPPIISGPTNPPVNVTNIYNFTAVTNANSYEFRRSTLTNGTFIDGAEIGLGNFAVDASTNLYAVRDSSVKFAGTYSFHLAHPEQKDQILTLNRTFVGQTNTQIQFRSKLGYATAAQIAHVQYSFDGTSWSDAYTQTGTGGSGELSFVFRSQTLSKVAGRTFKLRLLFALDFTATNLYFNTTNPNDGWCVDNFTVTNSPEVLSSTIAAANTNRTFAFAPTNTGSYLLEVRPLMFGDYSSEFGPAFIANAVPNTNVVVRINQIARANGNTWNIDFQLLNGSPAGYELWSQTNIAAPFTKENSATIQTIVPNSQFRAVITSATTKKFFLIKPL